MVEQALKAQELEKRKVVIPKSQLDAAFARFAASNKMSVKQLSDILDRAGVTAPHFKEYMRVQMGWGQLVSSRYRAETGGSSEEAVQRMLQKGGAKPSATEYLLQQVIFGYTGLRLGDKGVEPAFAPVLPSSVRSLEIRNLHVRGFVTDVLVDSTGLHMGPNRVAHPETPE